MKVSDQFWKFSKWTWLILDISSTFHTENADEGLMISTAPSSTPLAPLLLAATLTSLTSSFSCANSALEKAIVSPIQSANNVASVNASFNRANEFENVTSIMLTAGTQFFNTPSLNLSSIKSSKIPKGTIPYFQK